MTRSTAKIVDGARVGGVTTLCLLAAKGVPCSVGQLSGGCSEADIEMREALDDASTALRAVERAWVKIGVSAREAEYRRIVLGLSRRLMEL